MNIQPIKVPYEILMRAQPNGSWAGQYTEIQKVVDLDTPEPHVQYGADVILDPRPIEDVENLPEILGTMNAASLDEIARLRAEVAGLEGTVADQAGIIANLQQQLVGMQNKMSSLGAGALAIEDAPAA